ncbi:hypothetical protein OS493_021342 [Desmophyllum pertusum]|uniref:DUF7779 domain-containing protein n=1 Tax=Desmophyllum pertusum TaxID=174260 RepID=A0A9W9ZC41_9CNID|nr:hypothetical protein OS493_021342 [Desmophyllum pertusum]
MQVSAFLGPDDIPYEVINEGLNKVNDTEAVSDDLWYQAEIVGLLTKFSLFQRYGTNSFSVHRLVQEVIRSEMKKEQTELRVLSCAVRVLHHALANTRSPAEMEPFVFLMKQRYFFSVSQEKVKAQAMQEMKLEFLVHLEKSTSGEDSTLPPYFIDVPLTDRDYKLISCCMRQPRPEDEAAMAEADSSQNEREEEANQLREKGNHEVKSNKF